MAVQPQEMGISPGRRDFFTHNLFGSPVSCTDFHYPPDLHGDQLSWSLINVIFDYICTLEHTGQELQSKLRSGQFGGGTGELSESILGYSSDYLAEAKVRQQYGLKRDQYSAFGISGWRPMASEMAARDPVR